MRLWLLPAQDRDQQRVVDGGGLDTELLVLVGEVERVSGCPYEPDLRAKRDLDRLSDDRDMLDAEGAPVGYGGSMVWSHRWSVTAPVIVPGSGPR